MKWRAYGCVWVLALLAGCAVSHSPTAAEEELLGRFRFAADPTAFDGETVPIIVEAIPLPGSDGGDDPKARGGTESVLLDVSLSGPGVWDPETKRLEADVRITNLTADTFDEPHMDIVWVSTDLVVFEGVPGESNPSGGSYHTADIDQSGGVNGGSARLFMSILDEPVVPFNFTVDVIARVNGRGTELFFDGDDDRFNVETNEPAGDDCNDADPTTYPGSDNQNCECNQACDGCSRGCCEDICEGSCSRVCLTGCDCEITGPDDGRGDLTCESASTCTLDCTSGPRSCDVECTGAACTVECVDVERTCSSICAEGATCIQDCLRNGGRCQLEDCSGSSTCDLTCEDSQSDCKVFNGCIDDSTCSVSCQDTAGDCTIDVCEGSTCGVQCSGTTAGDCDMPTCKSGSTCDVACDGAVANTCGVGKCQSGSTCNVACNADVGSCALTCDADATCVLDCGPNTGRSCDLTCKGSRRPVQCSGGGNVWACSAADCP